MLKLEQLDHTKVAVVNFRASAGKNLSFPSKLLSVTIS
jgi:hypothetical protein